MDKLLSTREVAELLGVAPETVRYWRHTGTGPTARKVGRYVRYRVADVESWVASRELAGTGGEAA